MRELKCLRCGTMMEFLGIKEFQLGHKNAFFDTHIQSGAMKFEVYECPECGKSELYKAKEEEEPESEHPVRIRKRGY